MANDTVVKVFGGDYSLGAKWNEQCSISTARTMLNLPRKVAGVLGQNWAKLPCLVGPVYRKSIQSAHHGIPAKSQNLLDKDSVG